MGFIYQPRTIELFVHMLLFIIFTLCFSEVGWLDGLFVLERESLNG